MHAPPLSSSRRPLPARRAGARGIDPSRAGASAAGGGALARPGRPDEALESYRLAADADPSSADPHTAAGTLHESQGRPDEALESYRLAAEAVSPDTGTRALAGASKELGDVGGTVPISGSTADTSGRAEPLAQTVPGCSGGRGG